MAPTGDRAFPHETDLYGMSVEVETPLLSPEDERVIEWRFDELFRAGFPGELALEIAISRHIDLHDAVSLVGRGCPPGTAARILL